MEKFKRFCSHAWKFFKWVFIAVLVGGICGAVGAVFHICIDLVTEFRAEHTWVLFLLPVGGLAIFFLYKLSKTKLDTNRVIETIRSENDIPFMMAPLIFISSVITHLTGGSSGREGAALQLGGSVATLIGRIFRCDDKDRHILTVSGMAAVFAAVFGTPMGAAVFAVEVVSVGYVSLSALYPSSRWKRLAFMAVPLTN